MDMSPDGKLLLVTEQSEAAGSEGILAVRKMDGSPPIRLGVGLGLLSPDGTRVAAIVLGSKAAVKVLPIGAGEPATLPTEGMEPGGIAWFRDSRRLLFQGKVPGQPPRFEVIDTANGSKQAITLNGVAFVMDISPDSKRVLANRMDGTWALLPIDGGAAVPVPGISPDELPLHFADDRSLWVSERGQLPVRVYRLDVATGAKKVLRDFEPPDKAGVSYVRNVVVSDDGTSYAYQYRRWLSNLYVATGLK